MSHRQARRRERRIWVAIGGGVALMGTSRMALAQTWDGGGANNNWGTAANWNPDALIANDGSASVTFSGSVRPSPNLEADYSVNGLSYTASAAAFTIGSTTSHTLTIGAGGIDDTAANGVTQRISNNITLAADQQWHVKETNDLIISGNVNLNTHTLTPVAEATTLGLANETFSGAISGIGGLVKLGFGELTLSGTAANTYTGSTTVYGTLGLDKTTGVNAVPGDVAVEGGWVLRLEASNQIPDTAIVQIAYGSFHLQTFSETIGNLELGGAIGTSTATVDGTGTLTVSGANISAAPSSIDVVSCPLKLGALSTTIADDTTLTFAGPITQTTAGSSITKTGTGSLTLAVANTFTGGISVKGGSLHLGANGAISTGLLTLAAGTALVADANVSLSNAVNVTGNATFAPASSNVGATMSGSVTATGTLTISGIGVTTTALTLSGGTANNTSGGVTITQGKVSLGKTAGVTALNGAITIGDGNDSGLGTDAILTQTADNQISDTSTITIHSDGKYDLNGHNESIAGLIMYSGYLATGTGTLTLGLGGITVPSSAEPNSLANQITGKLSLAGLTRSFDIAQNKTLEIDATVSSGGVTLIGPGTLALTATNNTYTGTTTVVGGGTLAITSANSIGNDGTTNGLFLASGTLAVLNPGTISTNRSVSLGTATLSMANYSSTLIFTGNGVVSWTGGSVTLSQGTFEFAHSTGTTTVAPGSTLTITPQAQVTFSGSVCGLGDNVNHVDVTNNGVIYVLDSAQFAGNIDGSGSIQMITGSLTANRFRQDSLVQTFIGARFNVRAGLGNSGVSVMRKLQLGTNGLFDLADSRMIIHSGAPDSNPTGTWNGSLYTGLTGYIASGRNGNAAPLWDGSSGMITSQTMAVAGNLTGIGIAKASEAGIASTGVWSGQTVTSTDTLIMYTYGGDANLDGRINIDDYIRIDNGIAGGLRGWSNGDFNYDGVINIDDYTQFIDANIGTQGAPFSTAGSVITGSGSSGVAAVPEPSAIAMLAMTGALFLRRRRRYDARR